MTPLERGNDRTGSFAVEDESETGIGQHGWGKEVAPWPTALGRQACQCGVAEGQCSGRFDGACENLIKLSQNQSAYPTR